MPDEVYALYINGAKGIKNNTMLILNMLRPRR